MAMDPFIWGPGGTVRTPEEAARLRQVAAAIASSNRAPKDIGEGLSRVGDALLYRSNLDRADEGDQAGFAHAADLMGALGDSPDRQSLVAAMSDPYVAGSPGQSAVVQALLNQNFKASDPGNQLDLELKRAQLDAMHQPAPAYRMLTPDEAGQMGLPGGASYQVAPDGKVDPIGTGSGITINTGDNSGAFQKKGDELAATSLSDIVDQGNAASSTIGDLKTLAALGAQIDTGKGAELAAALGPYAQALGVDIKGLPEMQAYSSIIDRMAPQMRPAGSGSSSDTDVRMFLNSLPSLGKTSDGNQIIMQTLSSLQQHKKAAAEIAAKAFLPVDQGGITWQQAQAQIRALPDPYAGFNAYRKQAETTNTPAKPTSQAEFDALPSGSLYIDPDDGMTYRKP